MSGKLAGDPITRWPPRRASAAGELTLTDGENPKLAGPGVRPPTFGVIPATLGVMPPNFGVVMVGWLWLLWWLLGVGSSGSLSAIVEGSPWQRQDWDALW